MFCPSCGTESPIELNYCNRCGANLNALVASPPTAPLSVTKPLLIIGLLMFFITLGGMGGILSTAVTVAERTGGGDLPMGIVFFGMVTLLTVDILLFRLLSKLINAALSSAKVQTQRPAVASQPRFPQTTTERLQPAPSVTENTTRFFEQYAPASQAEPIPIKNKIDR
ncbi:MAG TPA: zinc ribbon domain-containing protein [Pyrinomonadaceae bacterium]|nr:zinc ribbon domain-containing protein [Pyrinomonadaceae bacterium]